MNRLLCLVLLAACEGQSATVGVGALEAEVSADGARLSRRGVAGPRVGLVAWSRGGAREALGEPVLGEARCAAWTGPGSPCVAETARVWPDGTREGWIGRGARLQQGFWLPERTPGQGALTLELQVAGARVVSAGEGGATLVEPDGRAWRVGGLQAWDARGREVEVRLRLGPPGILVELDDSGAEYPVSVDPFYEDAGTVLLGVADTSYMLGYGLEGPGDVDGDGYNDLAAVSWGDSGDRCSTLHLFRGGDGGPEATPAASLCASGDRSSYDGVVGVGDLNGDGRVELGLGLSDVGDAQGAVWILEGDEDDGLAAHPMAELLGVDDFEQLGAAVAAGGDLDGDGFGELLAGAPGAEGTGAVYVYLGGEDGPAAEPDQRLLRPDSGLIAYGDVLARAGDFNGDGYDDAIVGVPMRNLGEGGVDLHLGSAEGLSETADQSLTLDGDGDMLGLEIETLGDVNGDGHDDLVLHEAPDRFWDLPAGVYLGSTDGLEESPHVSISHATVNWYGGMLGAGDLDADGFADLVLAAAYSSLSQERPVYVLRGSSDGPTSSYTSYDALYYQSDSGTTAFGFTLAGPGDLDGDGYGEVAVGAYLDDAGALGAVYIYSAEGEADPDTGGGSGTSGMWADAPPVVHGGRVPLFPPGDRGCPSGAHALIGLPLLLLGARRRSR